VVPEGMPSLV